MRGPSARRMARTGFEGRRIGKARIPKLIRGIKGKTAGGPTPGPKGDTGEKA